MSVRVETSAQEPALRRPTSLRPSTVQARLALIHAAEQYFALHGFAGVSLKTIHEAAGHRNASSIHYHFGSRERLIEAIIDLRTPVLNARRLEKLDAIRRTGGTDLRSLVAVWIEPLAEELQPRPEGNHYLRFLDRFRREKAPALIHRLADLQYGYAEVMRALVTELSVLPRPTLFSRLAIAAEQVVSSLAALEASIPTAPRADGVWPSHAVETLIDYVAGGLAAPVSPKALGSLEDAPAIDFHLLVLDLNALIDTP